MVSSATGVAQPFLTPLIAQPVEGEVEVVTRITSIDGTGRSELIDTDEQRQPIAALGRFTDVAAGADDGSLAAALSSLTVDAPTFALFDAVYHLDVALDASGVGEGAVLQAQYDFRSVLQFDLARPAVLRFETERNGGPLFNADRVAQIRVTPEGGATVVFSLNPLDPAGPLLQSQGEGGFLLLDPGVVRVEFGGGGVLFDPAGGGPTLGDFAAADFVTFDGPCNPADLALTGDAFGRLDGNDIGAFVASFLAGEPTADVAATEGEFGQFDGNDIAAFVSNFLAGCP